MRTEFAVVEHWGNGFDEPGLQVWAEALRKQFSGARVSLGLVFMSPRFFPHAAQVLEILRVHARIPLLAGCSSTGVISSDREIEEDAGLVLALYFLPGATLKAVRLTQEQVEEGLGLGYWHTQTGIDREGTNGWLVFADPFHMDMDTWLRGWNAAYSPVPIMGGLASGDPEENRTQVYLDGEVFEDGGVAISIGGEVMLGSLISQGCTPIGKTWTITKAEQNLIYEIGNRPAYEVLLEAFNGLSVEEQKQSRGNLFVGLVMNEYLEEFHRGDFLIRNLLGADPKSGAIAVGVVPRVGQTMQFQRRDAVAATEDMTVLLHRARDHYKSTTIYGGCLCCCNGRGHRLFGSPHHDAALVQDHLGPVGISGFFCNGELGPVGPRSFLHGYTASLALFLKKELSQ